MKKLSILLVLSLAFTLNSLGQSKKKQDEKAIKDMCGCYEVNFNFVETFSYSQDSLYKASKIKHARGLEWIQLIEDSKNKISMQHLLIVGRPDTPHIVKHWRQDWLFENTDLYMFDHENKWKYVSLPKKEVKGQWTQKVFQVDDSPRYEGTATWVHVDGKSYWENTTDAPLPRREYTQRSDYNVTTRRNRQEITDNGWIHDQNNDKIIRENNKVDILLAQEKGYNTYTKVDDSKCKAAQDWWAENQSKWAIVRTKWEKVFARKIDLALESKVDNKQLFKYLFSDDNSSSEDISSIIDSFIVNQ
ncbi:DUF6607 family protein [Mangrovimonas aestuarii]|uniref:DUF6607 family protein n=1 Tax=Mangrovimonas aestuarii TaxID=3018443 RepID=UPI0023793DEB|nr:DUF6607 family protein [Mangrovimonas aestuarii]